MANLYEISRQLENFAFEIDEETGELLNAVQWDDLNMAYAEKVENIACYIKNLTSDIEAIKAEELSLKKRRQAKEKKVEYLKRLLSGHMGGEKFESSKCSVTFRKSEQVQFMDENDIPKKYLVKAITFKPDKKAIKEALKSGKIVRGCCVVEVLNPQIK